MERLLPQDGLVAVVKRDCPTCVLTAPVLGELARARRAHCLYAGRSGLSRHGAVARSRSRARHVASSRDRDRADPDPLRARPRGRAHLWLGPRRMGAPDRPRRARPRPAGSAPGLRREECRAGRHRTPQGAVQRDRPQIAPHRIRRRRGRAGGDVRARLVRRAAAGAADRGTRPAHARRHRARPAGGYRPRCRRRSPRRPSRRSRSTR